MGVRQRRLGAAFAAVLVATVVASGSVPAFAEDAPAVPTTTTSASAGDPTPTTTTTTTDPATTPDPTAPDATAPDATAPDATAPDAAPDTAAAAAPVAQSTPAVTVTPSTGLVNFQTVTLAGTGFTPGVPVGWAECKNNGSGSASDCDTSNTGSTIPDASGAFSTQFVVHRTLHTANGDVDCVSAPGACNLGAGTVTQPSAQSAGQPLTFDPNAPVPPPPTLTAAPTTGLHDGESISVDGSGYLPSGQVAIVQCAVPASASTCQTLSTLPADAAGAFSTHVTVHRAVATPPFGVTDCAVAVDGCQLTAVSIVDYDDYNAHVDLGFDPFGPLPPGQVTVTPDTGLVQFQTVTVAGSGFNPSSGVEIVECLTGATSFADCSQGSAFQPTDGAGAFSAPVVVRRVLHLQSGDVDCASAPGTCALVSTSFAASVVVVVSPISFDPNAPLPPPPTITVDPHTDLVSGQTVTVSGADFAPSSFVAVGECLTGAQIVGLCGFGGPLEPTDASGAFTATFSVARGVADFDAGFPPQVVDCAESAGRCSMVATSIDGDDRVAQAIDFDPSVPIRVPDSAVSPQFGLPDGAIVHVVSTGFAAHERVTVSECAAGVPTFGACADGASFAVLVADGSGAIDTFIRVHRVVSDSGGVIIIDADAGADAATTNCSDAVGACVVRVQSVDDPLVLSDVALGFDPTAVAAPPSLTATPAGPYVDGQQIEVHGEGFTPHASVAVGQCVASAVVAVNHCDDSDDAVLRRIDTDTDGAFTQTVTVHTSVQSATGPIDCTTPDSCDLVAVNVDTFPNEQARLPLEFGAGVQVEGIAQARALAFTGAGTDTVPEAVIGFGLVLLGAVLLLVARRRRA